MIINCECFQHCLTLEKLFKPQKSQKLLNTLDSLSLIKIAIKNTLVFENLRFSVLWTYNIHVYNLKLKQILLCLLWLN